MSQSLAELAELAELIAEENMSKGQVNLEKIAKKKKITIVEGDYGHYFLGELVHKANKFYIHLNREQLDVKVPGRRRFTIAHEYGHYFNDDHRNKLKQGISLAHTSDYSLFSKNPIEMEANHFASNLLLPKTRFLRLCTKFEPGFETILTLKEKFNTSIEGTALRYTSLDVLPCMFIKWNPDRSYKYASYTPSLAKIANLRGKPAIKVDVAYLEEIYKIYENDLPKEGFIERVTSLSKWVATISPGSRTDLVGLEQTVKQGDYGGITFLIFQQ